LHQAKGIARKAVSQGLNIWARSEIDGTSFAEVIMRTLIQCVRVKETDLIKGVAFVVVEKSAKRVGNGFE